MKLEEVKAKIAEIKKGTFFSMQYKSDKGNGVVKQTKGTYRIGIEYANMKINANKVTGELPWGQWVDDYYTYLIHHTPKPKNGEIQPERFYLRVYEGSIVKSFTEWFYNGEKTTYQWLADNGLVNTKKVEHKGLFVVPIENIIAIGSEE